VTAAEARVVRAGEVEAREMKLKGKGWSKALVNAAQGAEGFSLGLAIMNPSAPAAPYHHHAESETAYVVLEGRMVVVTGSDTHVLGPGDAVFFPPKVPHALGNASPEVTRVISVTVPASTSGQDFHIVDAPSGPSPTGAPERPGPTGAPAGGRPDGEA
jgi:mannose-6-phosphate isomerase-like protein (cupin superfamily)